MSAWVKYQSYGSRPPKPHKGGTNYLVNQDGQDAIVVKTAFGFHRQAEDWGEAAWTATDLR